MEAQSVSSRLCNIWWNLQMHQPGTSSPYARLAKDRNAGDCTSEGDSRGSRLVQVSTREHSAFEPNYSSLSDGAANSEGAYAARREFSRGRDVSQCAHKGGGHRCIVAEGEGLLGGMFGHR
jgi:hypothetical protein